MSCEGGRTQGTNETSERMSAREGKIPNALTYPPPPKRKAERGDNIPHGSKEQEIENLKRLLANVSQRLDALKTR